MSSIGDKGRVARRERQNERRVKSNLGCEANVELGWPSWGLWTSKVELKSGRSVKKLASLWVNGDREWMLKLRAVNCTVASQTRTAGTGEVGQALPVYGAEANNEYLMIQSFPRKCPVEDNHNWGTRGDD